MVITGLTRKYHAPYPSRVRMDTLLPWFATLPVLSIRQTMTEDDRNNEKFSPSDTGKVICDNCCMEVYHAYTK